MAKWKSLLGLIFSLPYIVSVDTTAYISFQKSPYKVGSTYFRNKDEAEDMAAALNDAHNRRVNTAIEPIEKCVSECLGR